MRSVTSDDPPHDATVRYEGTVATFEAHTTLAEDWLTEHAPTIMRFGRVWCFEDATHAPAVEELRAAGMRVRVLQAGAPADPLTSSGRAIS
ncbi:unnamed protein product [Gemmataceae bacterium]|nr:unnamed protein product [Gemmataceae bacterium]VTU00866.1 unnamed protein product [Gemmataceae bacterium]